MSPENRSDLTEGFACTENITPVLFELVGKPVVQVISCVLAIPMCLTATLVNLLVIISIWRSPLLNSPSNVLLVGLAFSDCGVGLVVIPGNVLSSIAKALQQASFFCKAEQAAWIAGVCFCTVSLLTVSAISLDRFVAIHYHLRYPEIATVRRARLALILIWSIGGICSLLYSVKLVDLVMNITNVLLILSLGCILFTSCFIHRVVRRHQRQIASQMRAQTTPGERTLNLARFKKSFKSTQILCCGLLLCYLPYAVINGVIIVTGPTPPKQSALELSTLVLSFNSTLNPFLYCWRYQAICIALRRLLQEIFCRNSSQRNA